MPSQIQFRRDTAANWTSCDPTLKSGELGYVTDTNQFKIGDGATAWSTLTYYPYIPINVSNAASGQQLTFNGSEWVNASLPLADTDNWGLMSDEQFDKLAAIESSATADQTGAEIKTAYEGESDTNAFTDADHTKLDGIDVSANNYTISADLLDEDNFASDSATKAASQQSIKAYVDTEVAGLINSAPSTLDTLDELADALGDDSNYAATVTTSLGLKAPKASPAFTGDATFAGDITVNTDALFVDASAKTVGIGTASPRGGSMLDVSATGASDEPQITISSENGNLFLRTAGSSGSFPSGAGGNDGELVYLGGDLYIGCGDASRNLIFYNGGSYNERMRINSGGQLLINTTSNGSDAEPALVVSGRANDATNSGMVRILRGENAASMSAGDNLGDLTFGSVDGARSAMIQAKAGTGWGGTTDCPGVLVFATAADGGGNAPLERMRIDSSGTATFAGVIKADAGIDFSGISSTAASGSVDNNLLDDYEEGTFTPTLYGSTGSAGSEAYLMTTGQYTKIGRLVHARFQIVKSNLGLWTGYLKIGGMPFTGWHTTAGSLSTYPSTNVDAAMRGIAIYSASDYCYIYSGSKLDYIAPFSEITANAYLQAVVTYSVSG